MHSIVEYKGLTWVDCHNPTPEDVKYLEENFKLHPVVLDQILPPSWGTRVERFPDSLFLVLFFAAYDKARRETKPRELDVICGKDFFITSHYNSVIPLKAVFDECALYEDKRAKYMGQGTGFLMYHVLHKIWEDAAKKVHKIDEKLTAIGENLFTGNERGLLAEASFVKADIINFWRIVRPQRGVFLSLRDVSGEFFGERSVHYFSHLRNHWARVMSTLITYKETIEALEETNNALLTDKTNEIVKLLTVFAVIVFPLTLLSSIFGMNTEYLPFVGLPGDFWIVSGIMLASILLMIVFFRRRRWI